MYLLLDVEPILAYEYRANTFRQINRLRLRSALRRHCWRTTSDLHLHHPNFLDNEMSAPGKLISALDFFATLLSAPVTPLAVPCLGGWADSFVASPDRAGMGAAN